METFYAYLAGFIDADGSIALCQNGGRLVVSNASCEVLEEFKTQTGHGYLSAKKKYSIQHNPSWDWCVGATGMREILPKVIPYMRVKKERAETMLAYLSLPRMDSRKSEYEELLKRNVRTNTHPSSKQKV